MIARIHLRFLPIVFGALFLLLADTTSRAADDASVQELDQAFGETVRPFLETYCYSCHGADKQKGKLDLRPYSHRDEVVKNFRQWESVLEKLKANEMPPEEAKRQPSAELRDRVINWSRAVRKYEASKNAGDPGLVLARRLSNAEYDYTIRDLTGVDIRPALEFPVDPANEAGFDNSGESLTMSSALLKKYLEAARRVAEHLVLTPDGLSFAAHPVVTESDRDKHGVQRIIDFYQRQSTNYTSYFLAAWRFQHRAAPGQTGQSLGEIARGEKISAKYLETVWSVLTGPVERVGPIAALQALWRDLPVPTERQPDLARAGCDTMRDLVWTLRKELKADISNLKVRGIADGSQPFVLWKDQQYAANRLRYAGDSEAFHGFSSAAPEAAKQYLNWPAEESERTEYRLALNRFCAIFPDTFYVPERGLIFLPEDNESQGRLLSAGFHLMTGYFRDDAPLYTLMIEEEEQRELDRLWEEFHFLSLDAARQYKDFIFFERAEPPRFMQGAEFDFARSEDKDSTSPAKIEQLARAYLGKAQRNGGTGAAITAIEDYFKTIATEIQRIDRARVAAEPAQLHALQAFAERAYRRPLLSAERQELKSFYKTLRQEEGLDHEDALRDALASILMSPSFCYRVDLSSVHGDSSVRRSPSTNATVWNTEPLSGNALASRLSYFLWSSMPDAELLGHAQAGDLARPEVLRGQTRRMMQDARIRRFATEFGGNWLEFRRFEEHNAVDRERFPTFNNDLRAAMFEEPIRFFVDIIQRDRSVFDFLYARDTFVNGALAAHYGMTDAETNGSGWRHVPAADQFGRGGVLPMSVFLTMNAPGLRTSPVKRGYWVVRRLLGEQIPPPPPDVPELPSDESKAGELTVRDALARHRQDKSCAGCHARFDGVGLVFEGYGPVGERRERDLGGRAVDTHANFPGGREGTGLEGLRRYLQEAREPEFLDNLCRKMLSYALGRTLLLSDDATVETMRQSLASQEYRFSALMETIIASPQFLTRRTSQEITP